MVSFRDIGIRIVYFFEGVIINVNVADWSAAFLRVYCETALRDLSS